MAEKLAIRLLSGGFEIGGVRLTDKIDASDLLEDLNT